MFLSQHKWDIFQGQRCEINKILVFPTFFHVLFCPLWPQHLWSLGLDASLPKGYLFILALVFEGVCKSLLISLFQKVFLTWVNVMGRLSR